MSTDHDQDSSLSPFAVDQHDQLYSTAKSQSCLSSSHSSHFFTYPIQDQRGFCHREITQLNYKQAANLASRGSNHHQTPEAGESDRGLKPSLWKKENGSHENQSDDHSGSIEWMPTKKRLSTLKMMKPDPYRPGRDDQTQTNAQLTKFEDQKYLQAAASSSSLESTKHGSNPIRVCSDCHTTKTPLWRSGPRGPKSLCNACGIRQRKARWAMAAAAAAAAAANGSTLEAETSPTKSTAVQLKDKRATNDGYITKYKKGSRISKKTSSLQSAKSRERERERERMGVLEGLYKLLMRRTSVYATFVIAGAFAGERAVDYGVHKIWEYNNVGKRYEDIPVLGQRPTE